MFKVGDRVVRSVPCVADDTEKVGQEHEVSATAEHGMVLAFKDDARHDGKPWFSAVFYKTAARSRERTLPETSAERKDFPLFTGPVLYFPAALAAVAKLCKTGNDKHNPGQPMHHSRGKSNDHEDCILRHMLDSHEGDGRDADGTPHVVMLAWRALAQAQLWLEKHDGAPQAPAARD